ncbi:hypothetical protein PV682_17125 [Streptomyces niveiscabiei]|uniref:hypothetical protein n=1 Tax=Streptomyces niveiscabiei TaxID=164115 RepID=UPI0029B4704B|nr:hypothetical protein [Streptomyces niveiscabiei]MDX3383180.1 hypothetical protein [Streptomyces niveiscabiei]
MTALKRADPRDVAAPAPCTGTCPPSSRPVRTFAYETRSAALSSRFRIPHPGGKDHALPAQELLAFGNVSLLEGSFADEDVLREGFRGCDGAFVDIGGFDTGEKIETYWVIRSYEIAIEEGIKFFVYGNLDYALKKSGYDSRFRTGHYDGKGRMAEWVLFQNEKNSDRMGAAVFTPGPYIEDGIVTWRVPLGEGAVPHVAIEHMTYADMAVAFEKVTRNPAQYIDTDLETYWNSPDLTGITDRSAGYNADPHDKSTMSFRDNFTGFWNVWKRGIITRDYALLDEIHPDRIRTAESAVLKSSADFRTGML